MPITHDLEKLLNYHEQAVQTLRRALELFTLTRDIAPTNGTSPIQAARDAFMRLPPILSVAATTRQGRRRTRRKAAPTFADRRRHTAQVLAQYSKTEGQLPGEHALPTPGLGRLVALGYLKHKGAGYVRTDKPYVP